jgi:hypothetical protein
MYNLAFNFVGTFLDHYKNTPFSPVAVQGLDPVIKW